MRFGLCLPNARELADPRLMCQLAIDAERVGWDGFFLWDQIALSADPADPAPIIDPWVTLGAIATCTRRLRIGTTVTPLARRRPPKLARETTTLDHLSGGRVILGVGLGNPVDSDFTQLGEEPDPHLRAERLDEGLELLTQLWSGETVTFHSRHYAVHGARFMPPPLQSPRIPIWVGGHWTNKPLVTRAARWDGVFPAAKGWPQDVMSPEDYERLRAAIGVERKSTKPLDMALATTLDGAAPTRTAASIAAYERAGVTWWMDEARTLGDVRARIERGPGPQ